MTDLQIMTEFSKQIETLEGLRNGMTSDQWYNEMIESSKVILNKSKFKQLLDTMEFDNTATKNKLK